MMYKTSHRLSIIVKPFPLPHSGVTLWPGRALAMAFRDGCRLRVRATGHVLFMDANPHFPTVCSTGTTCFANRLVSSGTLEEAVTVVMIRPGMARLAGREVPWRRVRKRRVALGRVALRRVAWRRMCERRLP